MRRAMQPVGLAIKSLQCMYLCSLKYLIFSLSHRLLFERVINLQMAMKKMKFFFKKFLDFEEKHGDEASVAAVKRKAQEYVDSHWVLPVPEPSLSAVPLVHSVSLSTPARHSESHMSSGVLVDILENAKSFRARRVLCWWYDVIIYMKILLNAINQKLNIYTYYTKNNVLIYVLYFLKRIRLSCSMRVHGTPMQSKWSLNFY